MKKIISILLVALLVLTSLRPMTVEAKVIGSTLSALEANETSYTGSRYPVGRTVFSDDLSETTVDVSGDGNPYYIHTVQTFKISLKPNTLQGLDWTRNLARSAIIQSGIPEAVFKADGVMTWHIQSAKKTQVKAQVAIVFDDGRQVVLQHLVKYQDNGWYSFFSEKGQSVSTEAIINWIGPEKTT